MTVVVRFAPSPTGRLHIGNVRTALLNWLFARKAGGRFLLRLDDTDRERSTAAFADAIRGDLTWLGLDWDDSFNQSDRLARYADVAESLKASGRLYPCYETEDELDRRRKRQLAMGRPPIYDRAALRLTGDERRRMEAEGRKPHWRFKLANTSGDDAAPVPTLAGWADLVRGDQHVDLGSLSDPVLIRADGTPLYTFTSVVDDIDTKITHVIRGEDHVTNTGVQVDIFKALGAPVPAFGHFSLLIGADGQGLSKRLGALSVEEFRSAGLEAMAVNAHAALIGTSQAIHPVETLDELVATFDITTLSRAPSRFDLAELEALNAKLLHKLPYDRVASRLAKLEIGDGRALWETVRGNLQKFDDIKDWHRIIEGPSPGTAPDAAFAAAARAALPAEPWTEATWGAWTDAIKSATGAKGRALFHPLRIALTGRETGPEMKALLPLIGRARTVKRLGG
jgi:glutamyl-tRNA synthetase